MNVLLTNDDGIASRGLGAVYDALSAVADVTVVAPAADQSAVGRTMSRTVEIEERDRGYAILGTPADCVVAGLEVLVPETDLVVAGCNRGANLGAYQLGRSGTVSAAVESSFFEVPAIAVSLYLPGEDTEFGSRTLEHEEYTEAARATRYLVEHASDAGVFEHADYLNVNAPIPRESDGRAPMEVTRPSHVYDMGAERDGERITLTDRIWDRMANDDIPDPEGTDRRAVVDGTVSVSPLTAPHTTERHEALDALAETYNGQSPDGPD